jgi:hypothetical protein
VRSARTPATAPTTQEAVGYLASDALEGRGIGTKGIDLAAGYIGEQFELAGLEPLPGLDGYFQRFEMSMGAHVARNTTLKLNGEPRELDRAFRPLGFSASGTFDGPVVFVGYGISSEKHDYDDYAGVDVKGKVALAMRFEPHNEAGKSRFAVNGYSDDATFKSKATLAAARGAAALLIVNPPTYHQEGLVPFAGQFTEKRASIPIISISIEAANALFAKAGAADLKSLQAKIDTSGKPSSMELPGATASGDVRVVNRRTPVQNVVALAPGRGRLKDEYVIVGAHYDHVGKSRMFSAGAKEGEIHNGADDNASGVSAVIGLARRYANDTSAGDRRSIVFATFTGEEWGLIGSQHFVDHPPVPLKQVAAMVNMDMVGRVRNDTIYLGGTGTAAGFDALLKAADEASPLEVKGIGKGGFGPSDHMSFAMKKIPVLFFFSGLHGDYHRPSDDADKINYVGIDAVIGMVKHVVDELAAGPRMDYIAVAERGHAGIPGTAGDGGGRRVTLGVVPDFTAMESTDGVRINGTTPGSPAEAVGLKEGDVITRFGEKPIEDLMDLTNALRDAKPGDKVKLKVKRDGEEIDLDATLAERKE